MKADISVDHLKLTNFRNYDFVEMDFGNKLVVITGKNGSGKTNLLEAISLLTPGRGLRNATLGTISRYDNVAKQPLPWTIFSKIFNTPDQITIGTGKDTSKESDRRIIKVNGEEISNQSHLAHYFSVCYLTPQMDQTFSEGATSRRTYLDKLTGLFYPEHVKQTAVYNHARSERSKLLTSGHYDEIWLNTIEKRMAEQAVAIAAARNEVVAQLQEAIDASNLTFPKAQLCADGMIEHNLKNNSALECENMLQQNFKNSREEDQKNGRTTYGSHRSDFTVIHSIKNQPAHICSTGEQKALLLSITMACVRARKNWAGTSPILLLDEVVAHLDKQKRAEFFEELLHLNTQTFLTGTDSILFDEIKGKSQFLTVDNGFILG